MPVGGGPDRSYFKGYPTPPGIAYFHDHNQSDSHHMTALPSPLRVLLVGAGPLGIMMYRYASERPDLLVTHVLDIEPALEGRDMGLHAGLPASGVAITPHPGDIDQVDVAILATVSDMASLTLSVLALVGRGWPVVSTCEEMFFPWDISTELSQQIDDAAKANGVAVLATGVNPGFLMDALPAILTGVCHRVERVEVRRYQDAQFRRLPFQRK